MQAAPERRRREDQKMDAMMDMLARLDEKAEQRQRQAADTYAKIEGLTVGVAELRVLTKANSEATEKLAGDLRTHMDGEGASIKEAVKTGIEEKLSEVGLGDMQDPEGRIRKAGDDLRGMRAVHHRVRDVGNRIWKRLADWAAGALLLLLGMAAMKASGMSIPGLLQ